MRKLNLIVVFNNDLSKGLFLHKSQKNLTKENITLLVVKLKKMKQMMRLHIENYSKKQELAKLILN